MDIRILKFHISTLEILFLWPRKSLTETTNFILLLLWFCSCIVASTPPVSSLLHQFYVGIYNVNFLLESIIAVCDVFAYLVAYICFLKNKRPIEDIIKDINMFLKYCPNSVIAETDSLSTRQTKWLIIYVSVGLGINLGWPLISRKNCIIERSSDIYLSNDPCGMITRNYYPFNANQPKIFWIAFIVETIYSSHICYVFSIGTATIIGLLMQVSAQLKHCGYKFEHISYNREAYDSGSLAREFKETVKYHQCVLLIIFWKLKKRILAFHPVLVIRHYYNWTYRQEYRRYTERIFAVFRPVVLTYIVMTSFAIAAIAYQVDQAGNIRDSVRYTLLLLGWGSLLFLLCLHAQKLQDESVAISNSIYNSGWTDDYFDSDVRRNIIITMHRTQKPIEWKMSCFGIISLSQFITILKSAYSVFALLVTVTERTTETLQTK